MSPRELLCGGLLRIRGGFKSSLAIQSLEQPSPKDKLLGWPSCYATCSRCRKDMRYMFQIASKDHVSFVFGDMGIAHLFQCAKHPKELFLQWVGS